MSDQPLSDDELLSSHLDGEFSADELTHLEQRLATEPDLRARLAALEAAGTLVATAVTPLTSFDAGRLRAAAIAESGTAANVTDLAAAGARRRVWPARVATAAAAVVALAIAVPALRAIDSGDDADTAGDAVSTQKDPFDESLPDDGDADTATDLATEAALSPAATGGLADDDSAMAQDADTADAEGMFTAADAAAYSPAQLRLFEADATFDPLADELGDFESTDALSAAVSQIWSAYQPADTPASTTTAVGSPEENETPIVERSQVFGAAADRLDGFALDGCPEVAEMIVDYFEGTDVVAADYASATAAGAPAAVGLFRLPGNQAVLLVIDLETCVLSDARLS